jgi:hypothetical protein
MGVMELRATFATKHRLTQEQAQEFWKVGGEFSRAPGEHTYSFETDVEMGDVSLSTVIDGAEYMRELLERIIGDALLVDVSEFSARIVSRSAPVDDSPRQSKHDTGGTT